MTRATACLWVLLLAVAPCAAAFVVWERLADVLATSSAAGVAAAVVVGLFAFLVPRGA